MTIIRAFVVALALGLLAAPLAADGLQPGQMPRVGVIAPHSPGASSAREAFRERLRDLGYAEGQNLTIESRWPYGGIEDLPDVAAELVRLRVDVIVTQGTPAAHAAKEATASIPIVMMQVGDPIGSGLVKTLARPGGNVTGVANIAADIAAKRLQILKEIIPDLARVAVLRDEASSAFLRTRIPQSDPDGLRVTADAGRALKLAVQILAVRRADDLPAAFAAAVKGKVQAMVVLPSTVFGAHAKTIVDLAATHRVPVLHISKGDVAAGGLASYAPDPDEISRRAARLVDKILKGAKPADLPVEQPTKFELVINLKTAKALGLTIPPSLLLRADQVIEQ